MVSSWIKDSGRAKLNTWIALSFISSFAAGYDGALFSGLLTLRSFFQAMQPPDSNVVGILGMSGVIGLIVGPWFGQWFSDRIGRPSTMLIGAIIMVVGAALTAIHIPNDGFHQRVLWIIGRVIVSLGSGITLVATPSFLTEIAHPRQRAIVVSFSWCCFYVGAVAAAWIDYAVFSINGSWSWRLACLFQAAPSIIQVIFLPFCPESPRWLVAKGKIEEAHEILAKYHANGDSNDVLVVNEVEEIRLAIEQDQKDGESSLLDLFRTPANRRRAWIILSLAVATQWTGNSIITYYLPTLLQTVGITNPRHQAIFNASLQVFNLLIAVPTASQTERFGRRKLFLASSIGMLISYSVVTALNATYIRTNSPAASRGFIAFLFLFNMSYNFALSPLAVSYPAEILPYRIRAKGMALSVSTLAGALTFNIWINPIALGAIGWKLFLVYIAVEVFFIINVVLYYPETKGLTPEEIESIFGDGKLDDSQAINQFRPHILEDGTDLNRDRNGEDNLEKK